MPKRIRDRLPTPAPAQDDEAPVRSIMGAPQLPPLSEDDYKRAYSLARTVTDSVIAASLLMSTRTFERRKKHDARLVAALSAGKADAARGVGNVLLVAALRGEGWAVRHWEYTRLGLTTTQVVATEKPEDELSKLSIEEKIDRARGLVAGHIGHKGKRKQA